MYVSSLCTINLFFTLYILKNFIVCNKYLFAWFIAIPFIVYTKGVLTSSLILKDDFFSHSKSEIPVLYGKTMLFGINYPI